MFNLDEIPKTPPRSISLLPGLKYSSFFDKWSFLPLILIVLFVSVFPIMILVLEKETRLPFIDMDNSEGIVDDIIDTSECNKGVKVLHYSFISHENRTYYGKYELCSSSKYSSVKVGDSIPIIYDPDDPTFNGIEGELGDNGAPLIIFLIFPLFIILFLAPMLLPSLRQINKARSIFKRGIIVNGEIIFVKRNKNMNAFNVKSFSNMEVFYRFNSSDDLPVEGKMNTDNDWLMNKLDIGSSIKVAYLKDKPNKSIILQCYYR